MCPSAVLIYVSVVIMLLDDVDKTVWVGMSFSCTHKKKTTYAMGDLTKIKMCYLMYSGGLKLKHRFIMNMFTT